jgi:signal transduction histidine kinase
VHTVEPLVQGSGNRLLVQVPAAPGTIHADATRVRQCLFNLLSNAIQYTRQGIVTLNVTRQGAGAEEWVIFSVADTGVGMTPDQIETAFDMFTQSSLLRGGRDGGGAGLGLFVTRKLCELMGGAINAQSEPGKGSQFVIRLPVRGVPRSGAAAGGTDARQQP